MANWELVGRGTVWWGEWWSGYGGRGRGGFSERYSLTARGTGDRSNGPKTWATVHSWTKYSVTTF